jgi:anaerobic magnesium-protoporphyrin IX monomethyl ester cyclase
MRPLELGAVGEATRVAPIVLIGFQSMGNLGLGYLASSLRQSGYDVRLLDIELPEETLVAAVRAAQPMLVGFSLIFQFYIRRYASLMDALRREGIDAHFTMGGHYPTLSPQQTLAAAPELDSIVRYEGEVTLLEIVRALQAGNDWRKLDGVVWRQRTEQGEEIVANPPRALIHDLDSLPYPERDFQPMRVLGRAIMPLLASRGCARTCSFCSIHTFYRSAPGKVVRIRKPVEVVREMRMLYDQDSVTVFLFQDDDFPLFGKKWRAWAGEFVDELHKADLPGRAIWKINCRADAVDAELMARMRDAGLCLVYMGLESGTEEGLRTLHKEISVEQNLAAVRLLKSLGIGFEFGFMLLDPSSTFASVRANVAFLREIVGDGSASAQFCKMLPYDGTPIKDALEAAGRLKGDVCAPDYDFLDPDLDGFYAALAEIVSVTGWIHGHEALSPKLNWAWTEAAVIGRLYPALPDLADYQAELARITAESNDLLFSTVERVADVYEHGTGQLPQPALLRRRCETTLDALLEKRNAFMLRHQTLLLRALEAAE